MRNAMAEKFPENDLTDQKVRTFRAAAHLLPGRRPLSPTRPVALLQEFINGVVEQYLKDNYT